MPLAKIFFAFTRQPPSTRSARPDGVSQSEAPLPIKQQPFAGDAPQQAFDRLRIAPPAPHQRSPRYACASTASARSSRSNGRERAACRRAADRRRRRRRARAGTAAASTPRALQLGEILGDESVGRIVVGGARGKARPELVHQGRPIDRPGGTVPVWMRTTSAHILRVSLRSAGGRRQLPRCQSNLRLRSADPVQNLHWPDRPHSWQPIADGRVRRHRCKDMVSSARSPRRRKFSPSAGRRWSCRELLTGSTHFNDIHRGVPLMSRTLLSLRLKQLEEIGVVKRKRRRARPRSII